MMSYLDHICITCYVQLDLCNYENFSCRNHLQLIFSCKLKLQNGVFLVVKEVLHFFDCCNQMLCTFLERLQVDMFAHSTLLNFYK
jgi:hypothetical protein